MVLITIVFLAIAVLHGLWGAGVWLPIRDEEALAHAVVGARGVTRMPGAIPCFLVSAMLVVLALAIWMPDWMIRSVILWGAGAVFLVRGALAYTKLWRRMTPEEPFASNDRRYYGPLCLALGAGLIVIIAGGG